MSMTLTLGLGGVCMHEIVDFNKINLNRKYAFHKGESCSQ